MTRKTWEELALYAMVCGLPSSDLENATVAKRTKKAVALQGYIVKALKEAYERGRADMADETVDYEKLVENLKAAPMTWMPALLIEVVEQSVAKKVFAEGGLEKIVAKAMKKAQVPA